MKMKVKHHQGRALLVIASQYPTVALAIFEAVQNALDGNASRIEVDISLKSGTIRIMDNGDGVSHEAFKGSLESVLVSSKTNSDQKLGQFGMGLLAMLGKCEYFTFTSCASPNASGYLRWKFVSSDIVAESDDVEIPMEPAADLVYSANGKNTNNSKKPVWWRTELCAHGIIRDKVLGQVSLDSLAEGIIGRYSAKMLSNRAEVSITIRPKSGPVTKLEGIRAKEFEGRPLGLVVQHGESAGKSSFEIFLAPQSTKNAGSKKSHANLCVAISGNLFRIPWSVFAVSAEDHLPYQVKKDLDSGVFEGVITADKCKLHSDRKGFVQDEAFAEFCEHIQQWYLDHASNHIADAESGVKADRHKQSALRALDKLKSAMQGEAFDRVREAMLAWVQTGSIGKGHAKVPKSRGGLGDLKALTEQAALTRGGNGSDSSPNDQSNQKERDSHIPATLRTEHGNKRQVVRNNSEGLSFAHSELPSYPYLWRFYPSEGMVEFNIRHPNWGACEASLKKLMDLQVFCGLQALSLFTAPENYHQQMMDTFDVQCGLFVAGM